jgi:hypothetical protein
MKLPVPPDVEFREDICLLIHRPRGVLNKAAINKIVSLIGELEFTLKKPFSRFLDTVAADAVDLNSDYIRRVSLYRRRVYGNRPAIKTAILATDSTVTDYGRLHASLTQVLRSTFAYSKIAKKPRNGSVSRSNCWRQKTIHDSQLTSNLINLTT